MSIEVLKKECELKNHFLWLDEADYEDLKDHLSDNFTDLKEGKIILTHLDISYPNSKTEGYIARVIEDFDSLVYFIDVDNKRALLVCFEGDYRNEVINKHNEKVLSFIKSLDKKV